MDGEDKGIPISLLLFPCMWGSETHLDRKISVCVRELSDCWSLHYHGFNLEMALVQSGFTNESLRTLMVSATLNGRAGCRSHHQWLGEGLKDIEGTQVGNVEPIFELFFKIPTKSILFVFLKAFVRRVFASFAPNHSASSQSGWVFNLVSLGLCIHLILLNFLIFWYILYVLVSCCVMFFFHIFRLAVTGMVTLSLCPRWHEMNVMPTAYINRFTFWVLKPIEATTWLQYFAMKEALRLAGLSMIQSVGCRQIPTTLPRFSSDGWPMFFCSQWSSCGWSKQATEQWTGFPTSHTDNGSSSCESEQISLQHNILHLWFK